MAVEPRVTFWHSVLPSTRPRQLLPDTAIQVGDVLLQSRRQLGVGDRDDRQLARGHIELLRKVGGGRSRYKDDGNKGSKRAMPVEGEWGGIHAPYDTRRLLPTKRNQARLSLPTPSIGFLRGEQVAREGNDLRGGTRCGVPRHGRVREYTALLYSY